MAGAEHRPWPAPRRPWAIAMTWRDLLFAHWPVDPGPLQRVMPPGLTLDTFDGRAWVGVVPFVMDIRPRFAPALPRLSHFPELNVRTYVTAGGRPGVWFFSLDAASRVAVRIARATFGLPYFDAAIRASAEDGRVHYESRRVHRGAPAAEFDATYGPVGDARPATPGTLEHFLTERYCLYAQRRGRLLRGEVHHAPWPLQPAACDLRRCDMARLLPLQLPDTPPLLHFARRIDVVAWRPSPA